MITDKIDIIVEVRTGSKRFPKKTIKQIVGKTSIELMIERLKKVKKIRKIILATTRLKSDDIFVKIAKKNKVDIFRGSTNDVMSRVLNASKFFGTEIIVEITGDNPLIDPYLVTKMINKYLKVKKNINFISNDIEIYKKKGKEITLGFSTKIFKSNFLGEISKIAKKKIDREVISNYIVKNNKKFKILNYKLPNHLTYKNYRLTVDYKEDFQLVSRIFEELYFKKKFFNSRDICDFLNKNPYLLKINNSCKQKRYI